MNTTIFLKTYNYTGELKFPLPTQVNYITQDADEVLDIAGEIRYYTMEPEILPKFIAFITGSLVTDLLKDNGDDDTFDNIPALIEEATQIFILITKAFPDQEQRITNACYAVNSLIKALDQEYPMLLWVNTEGTLEGCSQGLIELKQGNKAFTL